VNVPGAVFQEETPWRCGRVVMVEGIEGGCSVIGVTGGKVDVFHPDCTRGQYAPDQVTPIQAIPEAWTGTGEHPNGRRAMERFQGRVLEHARRPGGTKPGHTVTPESAGDIARTVAKRRA